MSKDNNSVLVIFTADLPKESQKWWRQFKTVVGPKALKEQIHKDLTFIDIDEFLEASNIYEASAFAEELSYLKLTDGSRLAKSFTYKGYELWWIHYNKIFLYFGLPYTQYKKLLEYLGSFQNVHLYQPPYRSLFSYYLEAYGCKYSIISKEGAKSPSFLPPGILLQILITLLFIPVLIVKRCHLMLFTGDKFDKSKDYDFRMKFIYQELRERNISFVEFIRSLEPWRKVLRHVLVRKRPVVYSEAVIFVGRFLSFITGGHSFAKQKFGPHFFASEKDPEMRFKFIVATGYLLRVYDDVWAIRIMKWILSAIGIQAAYITAAADRNFHTVLGCKLGDIPTVGILHGVSFKNYNPYDFLPGFDGTKMLSVDRYGLWSEWWKEYYIKNSKAYRPDQLYVSGLMRPLEKSACSMPIENIRKTGPIKVLFISEQLAVPHEVMPYLERLLQEPDIEVTFSFRPYRDGFRDWLTKHKPDFLEQDNIKISKEGLLDSIRGSEVVVGTMSTAVLEALLQLKVPVFFKTQKWGDYFELRDYGQDHPFFANNQAELVEKIKNARSVSKDNLSKLLERFFGDPYKNGGKWVVDQLEKVL